MRILYIIESLEFGGAEMVVVNLANRMMKNHEVHVCCIKTAGVLSEKLDPDIQFRNFDLGEGIHLNLPFLIKKYIRNNKIDVVNTNHWGSFFEVHLGCFLGRTKKVIHTVHGTFVQKPGKIVEYLKYNIRQVFNFSAMFFIDEIVTVSSKIKEQVQGRYKIHKNKIRVIHNGIPFDRSNIAANHEKKEDIVTFITVGRLAPVKNYQLLIRSFDNVLKNSAHKKIELNIVGDGPEKENLENLVYRLNLQEKIKLMGFASKPEKFLRKSDIFILTSLYEGISIAIIEAMREGLPVIASDVGGNGEIVEHNKTGVLFQSDDMAACSQAILYMLDNKKLIRIMGQASFARGKASFSMKSVSEKYLKVYESY